MDAPKRIWAWPFNSGWHGGYYRDNKHAIPEPEKNGSDYILAAEHDRLMAEKDAEISRLREAVVRARNYIHGGMFDRTLPVIRQLDEAMGGETG